MTRLAALSDIHGNLPALQAVMRDMEPFEVDHVVVAGDSVCWGPFSRQVVDILNERGWAFLRGNNEYYLLDYDTARAPKHWSAFTMPAFIHTQLDGGCLNRIASLPDALVLRFRDAAPIRVFHGVPDNPWIAINPGSSARQIQTWLRGVAETTIIAGHSHIAMERRIDGWHIFNPGAVGVPLDGDFSASYMILDGNEGGWELTAHRRVPFDYAAIYVEFERQRFAERCGIAGHLVIEEFRAARMRVHSYHSWKRAHYPDRPDSMALMKLFLQRDDIEDFMPPAYRGLDHRLYRG